MNNLEKIGKRLPRIEAFINQVAEKEKWNLPLIEVWKINKKNFKDVYLQSREKMPTEGIKAFPSILARKIFIKEGYVNRTTVLHEVWHFIQLEKGKIEELKNNLEIENDKSLIVLTEMQAEGFARKLARKYKKEWDKLCHFN